MKSIWKFPLTAPVVTMPVGAKIVHMAEQDGVRTLWAECDPEALSMEPRMFQTFGTGFDIPDEAVYVGTWFQGPFVWHLYDVSEVCK